MRMASKVGWLMRMGPALPKLTFANYRSLGADLDMSQLAAKMNQLLDPSLSWADVDMLRALWKGPFILKGILHPRKRPRPRSTAWTR